MQITSEDKLKMAEIIISNALDRITNDNDIVPSKQDANYYYFNKAVDYLCSASNIIDFAKHPIEGEGTLIWNATTERYEVIETGVTLQDGDILEVMPFDDERWIPARLVFFPLKRQWRFIAYSIKGEDRSYIRERIWKVRYRSLLFGRLLPVAIGNNP